MLPNIREWTSRSNAINLLLRRDWYLPTDSYPLPRISVGRWSLVWPVEDSVFLSRLAETRSSVIIPWLLHQWNLHFQTVRHPQHHYMLTSIKTRNFQPLEMRCDSLAQWRLLAQPHWSWCSLKRFRDQSNKPRLPTNLWLRNCRCRNAMLSDFLKTTRCLLCLRIAQAMSHASFQSPEAK
jgi:hypothetical protein